MDRESKTDQSVETNQPGEEFARLARQPEVGLLREFWSFLVHNKKWWLAPILLVLLLFGAMIVVTNSVAAPFIYSLW